MLRGNCVCVFFSSRRRHTRLQGDWSSDVCSSDLLSLNWASIMARMNPLDLRAWLSEVRRFGELRDVKGAHWNLELGAISELNVKKERSEERRVGEECRTRGAPQQ